MTKKKQGKGEVTGKVNEGDVTDNKDINSQEEDITNEDKSTEAQGAEVEALAEGATVTEAESGKTPDKDASQENTLELKLAEMQDKYLRLSAEFDNYRKRTLREKIDLTKHAGEKVLISLVPIMDDFERALKSMVQAGDCTAMKSGIDLMYNKFRDFLKHHGLREIESMNNDFNVDLHEAVNKVPVEDESMKGKVVDVVEKGYWLHDKVLRFSKVVVGE